MARLALSSMVVVVLAAATPALQAQPQQSPMPAPSPSEGAVPLDPASTPPPPTPGSTAATATADGQGLDSGPKNVSYGIGARMRWVSVPAWMLDLFTEKNEPLSSYSVGLEWFRRKGEFDLVVGLTYQNMSPPDGNWLGNNRVASVDTDFVQFRGLGFIGVDAAFVWHTMFNQYVGMHYGAGIGLAVRRGKLLRTSSAGCTEDNLGDLTQCKPLNVTCDNENGCNEAQLRATESSAVDDVGTPHRFSDSNVPPAIPIVNVLVGVDFRIPNVKGWEAKIQGGFFNAFFLGGGIGYTF
jgi:hypothetical protein